MNTTQKVTRTLSTLILAALLSYLGAAPAAGQRAFDPPGEVPNRRWISLSNTPGRTSDLSDLAASGSDVYLVWRDSAPNGADPQEIRFRASADGGASFGDAPSGRVLTIIPPHQSVFSLRAAAHGSTVYVLFAAGLTPNLARVSLIRSSDGGATFSEAVNIEAGEGSSPYPDLTIDDSGTLHLVFEDRGATGDILHLTSADGLTFSAAAAVAETQDPSFLPRVSAKGTNVAVVWHDVVGTARSKPGQGEILFARSSDSGTTFSAPVNLSGTPEDSTSPAVAWAEALHVAWNEGSDVVYRRSSDGGLSFTEPVSIGWAVEGERIRSPRVSASAGWVRAAWLREERTGKLRGPFVQHARDGLPFGQEQDFSLGLPGSAYGAAAIAGATRGMVAWPHTGSGFDTDSEILVVHANAVVCTISWNNPAGGLWTTAANWDAVPARIPGAADDVCITLEGSYTVTMRGSRSIGSLTMGTPEHNGQKLLIEAQGGIAAAALTVANGVDNAATIILDSNSSGDLWDASLIVTTGTLTNASTGLIHARSSVPGDSDRFINANVVNLGTVRIEEETTLDKHFTNENIFTVATATPLRFGTNAIFSQNGGTLTVNGSFVMNDDVFNFNGGIITGVVDLWNGSELHIGPDSTGAANFEVHQAANTISGNIAEGQTILIEGIGNQGAAVLTASADFRNAGTIILDSNSAGDLWDASLLITSGTLTVTSTGLIHARSSVPGDSDRFINGNVVNQGTVLIEEETTLDKHFTNENIFTVATATPLRFGTNAVFSQDGGTLTVNGTGSFLMNDDVFNFNGGSISGNVELWNGTGLHIGPGSTGAASFVVIQSNNSISGDLAAGQTVLIEGRGNIGAATLTAATGFSNGGTIILDSNSGGSSWPASLIVTSGTLTNTSTGVIHSRESVEGASGRFINGDVINEGTVTIEQNTVLDKHFINRGTFSVQTAEVLSFGANAVFTQEDGTLTVNGTGRFVMNDDVFNINGGSISGNVELWNGTELHIGPGSTGAASFVFIQSNNSISGDLAAGQTVLIEGRGNIGAATLTAATDFRNAGTIILDSNSAGDLWDASLIITSGTLTVTSTGLIHARSSAPGDSDRFINGNVVNQGTVTIEEETTLDKHFINENIFTVATATPLRFGTNAVFSQNGGTLTVNGTGSFLMNDDVFNFNGGTISPAVELWNGTELHFGPGAAGAGIFEIHQSNNSISGNIPEGVTVLIEGLGGLGSATLTANTGFSNAGRIVLDSNSAGDWHATLTVATGALTNTATGGIHSRVSVAGSSLRTISADIINQGLVDIDKNTTFSKTNASYTNSGSYDIAPGVTLSVTGGGSTFLNPAPGTFTGGGNLTLAQLTTFKGVGNLAVNISNSGQFHPGGSPGVLNLTGNYTQTSNGSFNAEIGGSTPGLFDQLNISGTAALAGTLNASLFGDYCPEGSYAILTYGSRSGNFTTFNLNAGPGRTFTTTAGTSSYLLNTSGPRCNTAPVAVDDAYDAIAGTPLEVAAPGVLGNDTDPEGDAVTAILVTQPLHGAVTLNSDGGFVYTPPATYVSTDSFTYKARDIPPAGSTALDSNIATVTISIIDPIPPTTTATMTPSPNDNGWNNTNVDVTLHAVDNDGGSGVKEIHFQINASPEQITPGDTATFGLTTEDVHTINYFAVDHAGNQESTGTLIVRIDKTPPIVNAPADVNRSTAADAAECGTVIADDDLGVATTSDNLTTVVVTRSGVPAGNLFAVGTTTVTYTATDEAGNVSTDTQLVTVQDDTDPAINAPADLSVSTGADANSCSVVISDEALGSATATDNCPGVTVTRSGVPAGNVFPLGTTVITYTATDTAGNTSADTQSVTVSDDTPPLIEAPADVNGETEAAATSCGLLIPDSALGSATATDNCTNVTVTRTGVPAGNLFPVGTTIITYTATDGAGNTSTDTQAVTVVDRTPPSVEAPADVTGATEAGSSSCSLVIADSVLGTATASDHCSTVEVTRTGVPAGNVFPVGTTIITYTARDAAGNVSTDTQSVTVTDTTPPTIDAPANVTGSTGPGANSCSTVIPDSLLGTATAADNCPGVQVTRAGVPAGNFFPVGSTTIVYTATDASGNSATDTQIVTVVDDTPPVLACPSDLSANAEPGSCSATVNVIAATATDNCSVTVNGTRNDGLALNAPYPVGTTTITWLAVDPAGNEASCTQAVTVHDTQAPVISNASASPSVLSPPDGRMVDVAVSYQLADNCGAASAILTVTSSDPDLGDPDIQVIDANNVRLRAEVAAGTAERRYTITITAADARGNSSSANVIVTVSGAATPLGLLDQVEDELERLINQHRGKKGVNHLEKALKDVGKAIEALRQQPQNRGCAANAIKNAVQAIEQAVKAKVISSADASPLLQALTQASRMLAAEALADAIAAGGNGQVIQTAQRMMADGDAAASSGDFRRAVQEYKTTINVLEGGGCGEGEE